MELYYQLFLIRDNLDCTTITFVSWLGSKVDSLWLSGQREEARRLSVRARHWNMAGIIVGVVVLVVAVVVIVVSNVLTATNCYDC